MPDLFHTYSYLGLFIILLLEEGGLPFPVPGDIFIAAVAFAPNTNYFLIILTVMLATVLGSTFLFTVSQKFGMPIILKLSALIRIKKEKVEKVRQIFRRHEKVAIILGRLTPGFRTITPMVAGTFKVSYITFWVNTLIASFIWANIYFVIGRFFGEIVLKFIK